MEDAFIHGTADVSKAAKIGGNTKIWNWVQIRENVAIGSNCIISKGVYIDQNVKVGNNVKIQNNVSLYQGVEIQDGVFIGPHVCFTNDKIPRAINTDRTLKNASDWNVLKTVVKKGASLGANSTVLPGLTIGEFALVGSGSVITKDVPNYALVLGNPAKLFGYVCKCGYKFTDDRKACKTCKLSIKDVK